MENKTPANSSAQKNHSITITNRKNIVITGVTEVSSANDTIVNLKCVLGGIAITGNNLKASSLSLEDAMLVVEGEISGIKYQNTSKNILKKIFK